MKHSGYLTTSGAEIYYEQYGSGTPLLILHGNSQSLAVFYPFLRTFLPDFQVILMDSRGTWAFPAVCPHSAPRVLYRGYGRRRYRPA